MSKKIKNQNNEKMFKNRKGITLIALVITIIILLILAGITISALTNTGIFARANDAKEKTAMAQEDESVKMAVSSATIEGEGELTIENLQDAFTKSNLNGPLTGNGPWTYTGDYGEYDIEKNGNITTTAKGDGSDNKIIKLIGKYGVTESKKLVKMEMDTQEKEVWKEAKIGEEIPEVGKIKNMYGDSGIWYIINSKGEVYAWGKNYNGQLGLGNTENQNSPVKIEGLASVEEIYISNNYFGSAYARTTSGELYVWGNNNYGQLGIGNTENQNTPTKIKNFSNVENVYLDEYSVYVKTTNGEVYTWGRNNSGQLGIGNTENQSSPVKIKSLIDVKDIYTDYGNIYAKMTTGELYAWGSNYCGRLGTGNTEDQSTPVKIEGLTNVEEMDFGRNSVYAKTANGEAYAWGNNEYGQLGIGNKENQSKPTKIEKLTNIKKIYTSNYGFTYAITQNGKVYSWGYNGDGELGIGNKENQNTPVLVEDLTNMDDMGSGSGICAKTAVGELYVLGYNEGQLGIEHTEDSTKPVKIEEITNVSKIYGKHAKCFACLTVNGEAYMTGEWKWEKIEGYGENQKISNLGSDYLDNNNVLNVIYTVDGKVYTSKSSDSKVIFE